MDNTVFNEINTTLNLNGPILSFSEQPTGSTGIGTTAGATGGAAVSFSGITSTSFLGGDTEGTGYVSYQWYEVNVGKLSDSTYITGTASTAPIGSGVTLTISNLITPDDNQRKFYVQADYVASAYQQDQLGIAKSTGNAWNEPLSSGIATVTVTPLVEIVADPPEGVQALINNDATMSLNADLTDSYFADDLQYQWYLNGEEVTDGTKTVTTTTTAAIPGVVEEYFADNGTHTVQSTVISNVTLTVAGGQGGQGGDDGGYSGATGAFGSQAILNMTAAKAAGKSFQFKIGKKGNDGGTGNQDVGGVSGKVDYAGGTASTTTEVTFTITEGERNSVNDGSDFIFDNAGCGGSPGTYELTARSGTHTRDVASGYENDRICTHISRATSGHAIIAEGVGQIGKLRFRNNWTTMDYLKPSIINIENDTPTLSVTASRGTFEPNNNATQYTGTHTLNTWYDYTYGSAHQSQVGTIKWVSGAAVVVSGQDGDGGKGGGAGGRGWSGGGGGGGANTLMLDDDANVIIVAAGGAGGGGASWQRAGQFPDVTNYVWTEYDDDLSNGEDGKTKGSQADGGGGGGGGGGAPGGAGGNHGADRGDRAEGGVSGTSSADFSGWLVEDAGYEGTANEGDGYANIKYTATTPGTVITTRNTTLSGTTSKTLTIATDTVGVQTCQCKISSSTASNSPVWSSVVNFVASSTANQNIIKIENIGITNSAAVSTANLSNGDYTFSTSESNVETGGITKFFSFYSPDKDMSVEMDLYGGKGIDQGSYTGGEGGYSRIRFTMTQNTEYVIVGLSSDLNAPFLYRKGELVACVGQGGGAGIAGNGGTGGGVSNEGQNGSGRDSGSGGLSIASGGLGSNGIFGSKYPVSTLYPGDTAASGQDGGKTIRCTKGVYWAQQGYGACDDIAGINVFRLSDGTPLTNTNLMTRGFKAGYNIIETAGAKDANGGLGGNGSTGGNGGSQGGGGGGSGYNDGSVTIISTQQGGSAGNAKVVLRVVT